MLAALTWCLGISILLSNELVKRVGSYLFCRIFLHTIFWTGLKTNFCIDLKYVSLKFIYMELVFPFYVYQCLHILSRKKGVPKIIFVTNIVNMGISNLTIPDGTTCLGKWAPRQAEGNRTRPDHLCCAKWYPSEWGDHTLGCLIEWFNVLSSK